MITNWQFQQIEKKINNHGYSKGINLGLTRIKKLLSLLGDPHLRLPVIHLAGTNGKGSTTLFISNALITSGYRVGTYLSPHLISYCERYLLNGQQISQADFVAVYQKVMSVAKNVQDVTAFEIMTAMAFCYFSQTKVDVLVLETGMGGRFDATNVCRSILTVITPISFDHQQFLGHSLAKIAGEKAGIIKKNVPVICAGQPPEAMQVIMQEVEKKDSQLLVVDYPLKDPLPFVGNIYRFNAALALVAIMKLSEKGIYIPRSNILAGFARTVLPGRYQLISKSPKIILDSAHNPAGFESLLDNLKRDYLVYKKIWVIGLKTDKDLTNIAKKLKGNSDLIIATNLLAKQGYGNERLAEIFSKYAKAQVLTARNFTKSLKLAEKYNDHQSVIVIAGSFLLSGEVLKRLRIPVKFIN